MSRPRGGAAISLARREAEATGVTPTSVSWLVPGHALQRDGLPVLASGCCGLPDGSNHRQRNGYDSVGHGECSCGALSGCESTTIARKAWHRLHKAEVLTLAPSGIAASGMIEPLDWLLNFAAAHDSRVSAHYWHMVDGAHRSCGCPLEGEDDR